MKMHKRLQKILAVALMTGVLSTSFVMGVSEAASVRQVKPAAQKNTQLHKTQSTHKPGSAHKVQPLHKNGSNHNGPVMHKSGSVHHGPVIHRQQPAPPPPPPPPPPPKHHHHHDDKRSMHTEDWIGALVLGGVIGAVITNNTGSHADTVEYVTE